VLSPALEAYPHTGERRAKVMRDVVAVNRMLAEIEILIHEIAGVGLASGRAA
jgi:hypothetical protein